MNVETYYYRNKNVFSLDTWYITVLPSIYLSAFREFADKEYGTGVPPSLKVLRVSVGWIVWHGWVQFIYRPFWRFKRG